MSGIKEVFMFSEELQNMSREEFEEFIREIINAVPQFTDIRPTRAARGPSHDFIAKEKTEDGKIVTAKFVIKRTALITPDYIRNIGDYWASKDYFNTSKFYIATYGTTTNEASIMAKKYDINIWDVYKLYLLSNNNSNKTNYQISIESNITPSIEDDYSTALAQLSKGTPEWRTYQQLSCDIFTHLFSPPLSSPRFEYPDANDRNRRDMIYENSTEHSFWKIIRDLYQAHYIVVDAKNHAEKLDKRPVIDIAHYLKPYGCGMFGILLSRIGAGEAAEHAIKEQWIGNNKMIVALNDDDILEMLKIKATNGKPEDIIRMKLADFRMGL